jgi:ankyrin repeat protein
MATKRPTKFTPLHIACQENQSSKVRSLLKGGTDPNILGPHSITPLIDAASRGFIKIVKNLLAAGADVNLTTTGKSTALAYAISNGHLEVGEALLKAGANANCHIDIGAGKSKLSALTIAAGRGYAPCVNLLLAHGANVDGWNEPERPLVLAARNKHLNIVRILLKAGANPKAQGVLGASCLKAFSANGLLEGVKLLLTYKVDVNLRDSYGMTAFVWSCRNGHLEIAKLLLKSGADPLACDTLNPMLKKGDSALIWAAKQKHIDLVRWLFQTEKRFAKEDVNEAKQILNSIE